MTKITVSSNTDSTITDSTISDSTITEPSIIEPSIAEPFIIERDEPRHERDETFHDDGPYVVILYNDDHHSMDQVISQIQKATGYGMYKCIQIMLEAHTRGRAITYTGSSAECERVASILRQIRLQVETDRF